MAEGLDFGIVKSKDKACNICCRPILIFIGMLLFLISQVKMYLSFLQAVPYP